MNPRTNPRTNGRTTARLWAAPEPGPQSDAWRRAVDVLARTVYGEARGELVRGKEAVACVIVNRVRRARERGGYWWGGGVESVCKKRWQFSCWNTDDPNLSRILRAKASDPVFQSCLRIARRACAGALQDPTRGAMHYHTEAVLPAWAEGKIPCARIGGHVFYNDIE